MGGDLAQPGPVPGLDQAVFDAAGHVVDARQLGGVDAAQTAARAGALVHAEPALGAAALTEAT